MCNHRPCTAIGHVDNTIITQYTYYKFQWNNSTKTIPVIVLAKPLAGPSLPITALSLPVLPGFGAGLVCRVGASRPRLHRRKRHRSLFRRTVSDDGHGRMGARRERSLQKDDGQECKADRHEYWITALLPCEEFANRERRRF